MTSSEATYRVGDRDLPPHPAANCFPLLDDDAIKALVADLRARGMQVPVVVDGRSRALAAAAAGVEVRWEPLADGDDPVSVAISANLIHRHMSESQRALAGALLARLRIGANQHREGASIEAPSQAQAAERLHVSRANLQRAAAVKDNPVLAPAIADGTITVGDAYLARRETLEDAAYAVDRVRDSTDDGS